MPLLRRMSIRRLRRRRLEVDRIWRDATRVQRAEHMAAVERILDVAREMP